MSLYDTFRAVGMPVEDADEWADSIAKLGPTYARIAKMRAMGYTQSEIGEAMGISREAIAKAFTRMGALIRRG